VFKVLLPYFCPYAKGELTFNILLINGEKSKLDSFNFITPNLSKSTFENIVNRLQKSKLILFNFKTHNLIKSTFDSIINKLQQKFKLIQVNRYFVGPELLTLTFCCDSVALVTTISFYMTDRDRSIQANEFFSSLYSFDPLFCLICIYNHDFFLSHAYA